MASPYCNPEDVRRYISSTLTEEDLENHIADTDAWIDNKFGAQTATNFMRRLSAMKTAHTIWIMNPQSISMGGYSETARSADSLKNEIDEMIEDLTKSDYTTYEVGKDYKTTAIKNRWDEN